MTSLSDGVQDVFWVSGEIHSDLVLSDRPAQPVTHEQVLEERGDLRDSPELVKRVVEESKSDKRFLYLRVKTIKITAHGSTLNDSGNIKDPNKLESPSTLDTTAFDCCVPIGVWRRYPSNAVGDFENYVDARNIIPLKA